MSNARPSAQFGIRTALAFLAAFAVGASVLREDGEYWSTGALLVVATCFAIGLCQEVYDLTRQLRSRPEIGREERDGLRLAMAWRVGIVLLLIGHYLVDYVLLRQGLIELPDDVNLSLALPSGGTEPLLLLVMITVLSSIAQPDRRINCAWWRRTIDLVGWPLAALMAFLVWRNATLIHGLVFIAIRGVENSLPLQAFGIERSQNGILAERIWPALAAANVLCCTASLIALSQAFGARGSRMRRRLWLAVLCAGTSVSAILLSWQFVWVFPNASPSFAEAAFEVRPLFLGGAGLLIFILASILAIRIGVERSHDERALDNVAATGEERGVYLHERRFVLIFGTVAGMGWLAETFLGLAAMPIFTPTPQNIVQVLVMPLSTLILAFTLIAGVSSLQARPMIERDYGTVRRGRFLVLWMLCLVLLTMSVIAIASLALAFCLSPWYRVPWLST